MSNAADGLTELDVLSQAAATILHDGPLSGYRLLVVTGGTSEASRRVLGKLQPRDLLDRRIEDNDDAKAMLAGLWLWFDALHESHGIAQDIASPTGSFWHAILHRREGDFSNAKYWYERCQNHRANRMLGAVTGGIAGELKSDPLLAHITAGEWNGSAFTELVEQVHRDPTDPRREVAVRLQQAEWQALFHHCVLAAAGSPLD